MSEQTTIPVSAGYVFNFQDHGAFDPCGRVATAPVSQSAIDEHNQELAKDDWQNMLKSGRGLLYLSELKDGHYSVSDWPGLNKLSPWRVRQSFHNMAGQNGRTDVWFNLDGSTWHGVNIGDNQILRVKRSKS